MKNFILSLLLVMVSIAVGYKLGKQHALSTLETEAATTLFEESCTNDTHATAEPLKQTTTQQQPSAKTSAPKTQSKPSKTVTPKKTFDANAVSMIAFSQGLYDDPTISLRNNSENAISRVRCRLLYLNMNDEQFDYQDLNIRISIEPGLTKSYTFRSSLDKYNFQYYKPSSTFSLTTYKVEFKLLDVE